jgi:cell division protein ZapA
MDELTISVSIADRPYRMTIKRSEEEMIRKAADEINKNIKHYSDNFAYNDRQDLLAMVALEKATSALLSKNEAIETDHLIMSTLSEIDGMLSENLNKK